MARLLSACVVLAVLVVGASAGWKDLFGFPWSSVPMELATSVACPNASLCYVAGSQGNTPFAVYIAPTSQNFQNCTLANNIGHSLMILSIAAEGTTGATAGVGGLKDPGVLYTTDGFDWQPIRDIALVTGQDVEAIDDQNYAFIGATNAILGENGVLSSSNGGKNWKAHDWKSNLGLPQGVSARYGAFPSATTWYVSAGSFPGGNSSVHSHIHTVSATRHFDRKTGKFLRGFLNQNGTTQPTPVQTAPVQANTDAAAPFPPMTNGYYAAMTKSTDGGNTWTVQYTNAGAFYFNDVDCASETMCIAVAEGFSDGNAPGARVFVTTDGENWTQTLLVNNVQTSFMWVRMVSATEAWIGGSFAKSQFSSGAVFYQTTDAGQTWTAQPDIKGLEEVMSIWMVNANLGYATAITEADVTTILEYTPN